ncbi:MAG TPA: hypothetical protein VFO99_19850 [Pyrinomonadaceae bacterium]|nr:hypothetical protein [Pyrinomonadaceae bacterium]
MTELFENFEVNRDSRVAMLLRLLGASLAVHLVLIWVVIYVPAVRDTVNIAALVASTKWVDADYVATQIGDDVQIVELEKFRYPDGYFAPETQGTADPAVAAANDPFAPKIISQWKGGGPDPEQTPSPSPEASPSASPSPVASASPSAETSPAIAQNASPSPSASPLSKEEAQKELEKTAAQNDVTLPEENQINKKPLRDFAARANELKNQGKLDLNKPFKVVIEAQLDANAKLQNSHIVEKEGDENVINLFRDLVAALNDSGFLTYLSPISKDNPGSTIRITVKQGENEVLASVESETTSPERAKALASVLNNLLYFGAGSRAGKDEEVIMKNTNATPDGKKVVVNFSMPRQSVVDMIKKQMEPGA